MTSIIILNDENETKEIKFWITTIWIIGPDISGTDLHYSIELESYFEMN